MNSLWFHLTFGILRQTFRKLHHSNSLPIRYCIQIPGLQSSKKSRQLFKWFIVIWITIISSLFLLENYTCSFYFFRSSGYWFVERKRISFNEFLEKKGIDLWKFANEQLLIRQRYYFHKNFTNNINIGSKEETKNIKENSSDLELNHKICPDFNKLLRLNN